MRPVADAALMDRLARLGEMLLDLFCAHLCIVMALVNERATRAGDRDAEQRAEHDARAALLLRLRLGGRFGFFLALLLRELRDRRARLRNTRDARRRSLVLEIELHLAALRRRHVHGRGRRPTDA